MNNSFKNNTLPLISIITVVFNGETSLDETINSVINQSYKHIQYIIIDGGSTDTTIDIIQKYQHAIDYWVSEPDKGIFHAMNKGASAATGDYIYFLNAGDRFYSNTVLENVFNRKFLANSNDYSLIVGQVMLTLDNEEFGLAMCKGLNIPHQGAFVNRSIFEYIKFNEDAGIFGDALFWRKMSEKHLFNPFYIDTIVALFPMDGVGSSPEFIWKRYFESKKELLRTHDYLAIFRRFLLALIGYFVYKIFGKRTYFNIYIKSINFLIR